MLGCGVERSGTQAEMRSIGCGVVYHVADMPKFPWERRQVLRSGTPVHELQMRPKVEKVHMVYRSGKLTTQVIL